MMTTEETMDCTRRQRWGSLYKYLEAVAACHTPNNCDLDATQGAALYPGALLALFPAVKYPHSADWNPHSTQLRALPAILWRPTCTIPGGEIPALLVFGGLRADWSPHSSSTQLRALPAILWRPTCTIPGGEIPAFGGLEPAFDAFQARAVHLTEAHRTRKRRLNPSHSSRTWHDLPAIR